MKTYISLIITLIGLLSSCQNSFSTYGTEPVQLRNISFNKDIAEFLSDASSFDMNLLSNLRLQVDEHELEDSKNDSVIYYLQYSLVINPSDVNLANYNNFKFKTLELITDLEEKNVLVWMAKQDDVSANEILSLFDQINNDFKDATISSKDLQERSFMDRGIKMVWRTPNRVIKLVLNNFPSIQLEEKEQEYTSEETIWDSDNQEKELYTKEELIDTFKKAVNNSSTNTDITLFIAEPHFDKSLQDFTHSSSGTMTSY